MQHRRKILPYLLLILLIAGPACSFADRATSYVASRFEPTPTPRLIIALLPTLTATPPVVAEAVPATPASNLGDSLQGVVEEAALSATSPEAPAEAVITTGVTPPAMTPPETVPPVANSAPLVTPTPLPNGMIIVTATPTVDFPFDQIPTATPEPDTLEALTDNLLTVLGRAEPTATSTRLPTLTPTSTATATPTATNTPTITPTPTETATPTITPTATETPLPTATLAPTNTPVPPRPAAPTATPLPTATPEPSYDYQLAEFFNSPTTNPFLTMYVAIVDPNEIPIGDLKIIGKRTDHDLTYESPLSKWHYEGSSAPGEFVKTGNVKFEPPGGIENTKWIIYLADANGNRLSPDVPFETDPNNPQWYFVKFRRDF